MNADAMNVTCCTVKYVSATTEVPYWLEIRASRAKPRIRLADVSSRTPPTERIPARRSVAMRRECQGVSIATAYRPYGFDEYQRTQSTSSPTVLVYSGR